MRFIPSTPADHARARRNTDPNIVNAYILTQAAQDQSSASVSADTLSKLVVAGVIAGVLFVMVNASSPKAV